MLSVITGYNLVTGEVMIMTAYSRRRAKRRVIEALRLERQNLRLIFDDNTIYAYHNKDNFVVPSFAPDRLKQQVKAVIA